MNVQKKKFSLANAHLKFQILIMQITQIIFWKQLFFNVQMLVIFIEYKVERKRIALQK
ncbi:unnamed protein product [Paramecium pentaurelia]|uniref:Transmembrane protein n=1 Tax=Paramecium pentaurelia TaxID=43138 RepID=A0A8S1T6Y2_9CILI|nr:unnamed protein product [Paramecium pentaurelia]